MIALKLAAICPCVLLAGAVTAAWMPKSWEQSTKPSAADAPATHSQEHPAVIARQICCAVAAHGVTVSVPAQTYRPVHGKKQRATPGGTQNGNSATLQAALNGVGD